jgi:hypothetical protein
MKNGQGVTSNIFKRLFNYINTKRYERKEQHKEFKKDWGKVKWQYRALKLAVITGVYYAGLYFSKHEYNVETINAKYMNLWEEISNEVQKGLNNKVDFGQFYEELQDQLINYYKFELFEDRQISNTKEGKVIERILKQLDTNNIDLKILNVKYLLTPEENEAEVKEVRAKLK